MSGAAAAPSKPLLTPIACGKGGLHELSLLGDLLKGDEYLLVRINVGEGTFSRSKLIQMTLAYDSVPTMRRAKIGSKRADIVKALGESNVQITFQSKSELSAENITTEIGKVIKGDSSGNFSISKLKQDYENKIRSQKVNLAAGVGRPTAADLGNIKADAALKAVQSLNGPFNWALFSPDSPPSLINAGSLSVPEMLRFLTPETVACGLVRMSFGSGKFRRTKYIFMTYCGDKVKMMDKVKLQGAKASLKSKMGNINVEMQASQPDELSLKEVIDKVRKATVVDGADVQTDKIFSVEEFMKALQEDADASKEFFGETSEVNAPVNDFNTGGRSSEALIDEIRKGGPASISWAAFTVNT